jgi:hypothetical protein
MELHKKTTEFLLRRYVIGEETLDSTEISGELLKRGINIDPLFHALEDVLGELGNKVDECRKIKKLEEMENIVAKFIINLKNING